nr:hypothetical protein GCM10025732_25740 [Glycomyces mayteni]
MSLAVASNGEDVTAGDLVDAIGPALAAGEPIPLPEGHAEVDPEELQAREGTYVLDSGGSYTVTATEDGLEAAAGGADAVAAMFASADFTAEDVAAHEALVAALLAGETDAGREELEAVEGDIGAIEEVRPAGTVEEQGELRTYVELVTAEETVLGWYALDERGGIGGVWLGAEPRRLRWCPPARASTAATSPGSATACGSPSRKTG